MPRIQREERNLLLLELEKRKGLSSAIRATLFKEQLDFIDDPIKLKTAQCTRRAGKSYSAGAYLTLTCLDTPGVTCLYIATTREQARRILFKDVLKTINKKFAIGLKFNHTSLEVIFPNGSVLYLIGTDSKPEEIEKALGQKYKLVIIDEAGSHKQDQRHMVHEILEPACADQMGTICLMGSPQNNTSTYFFDITYNNNPSKPGYIGGWSRHYWTWEENIHVRTNMQKLVSRLRETNPRIEETAPYQRSYLNMWVVDPGLRVYKYTDARNSIDALPKDHTYYYYLGLDLGFNDDTAIVIAACSSTDKAMYFVEVFKQKGMDITDVANKLGYFKKKYLPVKYVVDGASKQAVEELKKRHGYPLETAEKTGKADMIEIMNADFLMERIKVLPEAELLVEEWEDLVWDHKVLPKKEEHPGCPNHAADGGLYTWRMCFHYAAKEREIAVDPNSDSGMEAWWEKEAAKALGLGKKDWIAVDWEKEYGEN